jgi:CheY-like chemotaxis protein
VLSVSIRYYFSEYRPKKRIVKIRASEFSNGLHRLLNLSSISPRFTAGGVSLSPPFHFSLQTAMATREFQGSTLFPDLGPATGSILVAEDDPIIRRRCCRILEESGATVLDAQDGEAALRLVETHENIDLVIVDLTMPRLGGRDVAGVLSVFRPGLPVLAMSDAAHKIEPDRRLPILAKPFSAHALIAATREMRLRAREMRIWADEKRAQARQLSLIAAAMQKRTAGPAERVDLVELAREMRSQHQETLR